MFLTLSERVLADLTLFTTLPAECERALRGDWQDGNANTLALLADVAEFCNISLAFLEAGPNPDMIGRAAGWTGCTK